VDEVGILEMQCHEQSLSTGN